MTEVFVSLWGDQRFNVSLDLEGLKLWCHAGVSNTIRIGV